MTKDIGKNIFAGFAVSLIALPLSLGLALASGVPPLAGVISAVVGGIIVFGLGGSHVTITGPGNGLVVVTLGAVISLGQGDMYAGYLLTLAAIVCSGVLIFLLGLFRFGGLSDFFPSPAIQGMLAAIGVIIMSKQLHVMLGEVDPAADGTIALLTTLPESISVMIEGGVPILAWGIGLGSLAFLFIYPNIHSRILHFLPAPMWVVLLAVGLTVFSESNPEIIQPLDTMYLLSLPSDVVSQFAFPDFSKAMSGDFIIAVFSLTFIASIESLLSIKAVDKLDPLRRRSNVNKDLRALGLATTVSGLIGGVNVVTVIARSSINVNNGATNRIANLAQGVFIGLFVLLFSSILQKIPLPTLAAILVYTGYKLASPSVFKGIARVGLQQLFIFLITMISTLFFGLIAGILLGILSTFLFQVFIIKEVDVIVRNIFRPNTLLYQESDDQYHLSIRAFSNFLNFLGLKKKLDTVPNDSNIIVDFSLSKFVDYSVLEQLEDYYQNFKKSGGNLEIVGLDNLKTGTTHPLAQRTLANSSKPSKSLTSRQKSIRIFAHRHNWHFDNSEFRDISEFNGFKYFNTRIIDNGRNRIVASIDGIKMTIADLDYHEGEFIAKESLHSTAVCLELPIEVPQFVLDKENLLDRVAYLAGFRDINFEKYVDFSKRYKLSGDNVKPIKQFFDGDLISFFEENKAYHLESNGNSLLLFEKERVSSIGELKQLASFASRLANLLNSKLQQPC